MTSLRIEQIAVLEFFAAARKGTLADKRAALDLAQTFGHALAEIEFERLVEEAENQIDRTVYAAIQCGTIFPACPVPFQKGSP